MAFINGDRATGAQAITFKMDIGKSEVPEYAVFCVKAFSQDFGIQSETWKTFCSEGFSSTQAVGYDISFSGEIIVEKGSKAHDFIKPSNVYELANLNQIPIRIENALDMEAVETKIAITKLEEKFEADAIISYSFEAKPANGKPTVVPMV